MATTSNERKGSPLWYLWGSRGLQGMVEGTAHVLQTLEEVLRGHVGAAGKGGPLVPCSPGLGSSVGAWLRKKEALLLRVDNTG